jgi:aspartate aminotransferase|tara:strand:- start:1729 stop:2811 length:1083 start_codon:yes stop_codon:yes gene_type:complete
MFNLPKDKNLINLALGELNFGIPPKSKDAISQGLVENFTHYTPNKGIPELRTALVEKIKEPGVDYNDEEIIITSGASEALHLAILTIVDKGNEVLIPDPGFVSYSPLVNIASGKPVPYRLKEENSFYPEIKILKELINKKTKMIIINSPSNPTGAVFPKSILKEIADISEDQNITILSDEVYNEITYERNHQSIAKYSSNAIMVNSFSKSYAMTGLRLGYTYTERKIIEEMLKIHQYIQASTCSLSQISALAALRSKDFVDFILTELLERRNLAYTLLKKIPGVECSIPQGAFYLFPNFSKFGKSETLAMRIYKEAKVVTTPGNAFGKEGEGYLRLSYGTDKDKIKLGINRIRKCLVGAN